MSDAVQVAIITGVSVAVPQIVVGILIYLKGRKRIEDIHTLVNSNMGVQLRISAGALRRIADLTKDPADVRIADEAERLAMDHESKQHTVDVKQDATGS